MKKVLLPTVTFITGVILTLLFVHNPNLSTNQGQKIPAAVMDNGYLLIKVDSPKKAREMMILHDMLSTGESSPTLRTVGLGNVMDTPQGFSKTLGIPIAFNRGSEQLAFLVKDGSKKDGFSYKMVDSVEESQPVYLVFWPKKT